MYTEPPKPVLGNCSKIQWGTTCGKADHPWQAIVGPGGPSMATKSAIDGPGGPVGGGPLAA